MATSQSKKCNHILTRTYTEDSYFPPVPLARRTPFNKVINFVPQQEAWVIERFGKFHSVLEPGINILIPVIDRIKYVHNLKEISLELPPQSAITKDNVALKLDGVLFYKVVDAYKASYGIEDHELAISQLAQTTVRSEIGKMSLDDAFKGRDHLNQQIVGDLSPPMKIMEAMQLQVEAERRKRAFILESEGKRDAQINEATGEANAIVRKATAKAEAITKVAESLNSNYIGAFAKLAKESNTMILPANANDITNGVVQAMAIYQKMSNTANQVDKVMTSLSSQQPQTTTVSQKMIDLTKKIPPEDHEFYLENSPTNVKNIPKDE